MQKDSTKYSLLIVEDNPGDALLIREYLSEYMQLPESEVATSFMEARECLQSGEKRFDLIFLDLTLQDLRGEALVTAILELSGDTPVIVLTGFADMAFSVRSLELGVSDYLLKDDLTAFSLYKSIIYNIERIRHTRAIEEQNTKLREIAWTQSHVVRAPLARLMGLVALSKVTPGEDIEEREFCLDEIENAAMELDAIIKDIAAKAEVLNMKEAL